MKIIISVFLSSLLFLTSCGEDKVKEKNTESKKTSTSFVYPYGDGFIIDKANPTKDDVASRIEKAGVAIKNIPAGFEWRFTKKYLVKAKKLVAENKFKEAYKNASKSLFEAESAIQQDMLNEKQWKNFVIK